MLSIENGLQSLTGRPGLTDFAALNGRNSKKIPSDVVYSFWIEVVNCIYLPENKTEPLFKSAFMIESAFIMFMPMGMPDVI